MLARALITTTPLALATAALAQCPQLSVVPGCGYNGVYPSAAGLRLWDPDGPGPRAEELLMHGVRVAGTVACDSFVLWDGAEFHPLPGGWRENVGGAVIWNGDLIASVWRSSTPGPGERVGVYRYVSGAWEPLGDGSFTPLYAPLSVCDGELLAQARDPRGQLTLWRFESGAWVPFAPSYGRFWCHDGRLFGFSGGRMDHWSDGAWRGPDLWLDLPIQGAHSYQGTSLVFAAGRLAPMNYSAVYESTDLIHWNLILESSGYSMVNIGVLRSSLGTLVLRGPIPPVGYDIEELQSMSVVEGGIFANTETEGSVWTAVEHRGKTILGGGFRAIDGRSASGLLALDAAGSHALVPGLSGPFADVTPTDTGMVVLVRHTSGTAAWGEVLRQTESGWESLGLPAAKLDAAIPRFVFERGGQVFAGGSRLWRLDVQGWTDLGGPWAGFDREAGTIGEDTLLVSSSGVWAHGPSGLREYSAPAGGVQDAIVRGGVIYAASGGGVKVLGESWTQLGGAFDLPVARLGSSGSEIFAFGPFTSNEGRSVRGVAHWNGAAWTQVPLGSYGNEFGTIVDVATHEGRVRVLTMSPAGSSVAARLWSVAPSGLTLLAEIDVSTALALAEHDGESLLLCEGARLPNGSGGWLLRYGPGPNPCPADLDCTGGIDGDDIIAFFAAWERGDLAADINADAEVDGDDVTDFFARWDVGC